MTSRNIKFTIKVVSVVLILISIFTVTAESRSFRNKLTNPCNKFKPENRNECMQQRSRNYTIKLFKHFMKKRQTSSLPQAIPKICPQIKHASQYTNIIRENDTRCPQYFCEATPEKNPCLFQKNDILQCVNITKDVYFLPKDSTTYSCNTSRSDLVVEKINIGMTCIFLL